jgi:transcriptional regulator with XRE-family HTH domain
MIERLKELRKSLGLNQASFAAKIHVAQTTYSQLENGVRKIKDIHISQICNAFNVNEEWLRTGNGPMFLQQEEKVNQLVAQFSFPEIVAKMLRAFDQLSPDQQAAVLGYARSFLSSLSDPLPAPVSADEKRARDYIAAREKEESSSPSQADASENA